jgi:hypothetical protein
MKAKLPFLIVVALLLGSAGLRAEETKTDATLKPAASQGAADASKREELRKRREEAEKLTPEQRETRRKEAAEKREARIKALQAKKKAGSLTEAEAHQLERLEAQNARFKKAAEAGAKAKETPKPTDK